ncbi:hypothetical protein P154DRAFT_519694 [Amniculicola lignicola CBS 123094]|uniref:Uncharacterized protein n=1 Tax=Amniculicola lignicola CBS 123094 TaxID=1392246 RepID=A0A6A5WQK8_9PLEO|nr:hypothetical protein P154DRAFT_519694 [Amniculicola lignicola CBS 123094]
MTTTTTNPSVTLNEKPLANPFDNDKVTLAEVASISSNATTLYPSTLAFTPLNTFHIDTLGIGLFRIPTPPSELEIYVQNLDGSLAYKSTRAKRSSGNCVLSNAQGENLIATEYFWGPNRDPIIHVLANEASGEKATDIDIKTTSPWTSRSHKVPLPSGSVLEWQYKTQKGFGGQDKKGQDKRGTALVCTLDGKRVAALIRNDETRTVGSKSCSAGNGGDLLLGEDVGVKTGVSEEMVVATCLLMLKKEIDRMRGYQAAAIGSAVS